MTSGTTDSWAGKVLALRGDKQMPTILILAVTMQVKNTIATTTSTKTAPLNKEVALFPLYQGNFSSHDSYFFPAIVFPKRKY